MTKLRGSVAVVTGAGSGIGRALVVAFAAAGTSVVAADVDRQGLNETEELVAEASGPMLAVVTDVRMPDEVEALADAAISRFGSADIVCSNAGVMRPGAIWEQPAATWDRVIGVNLMGSVNLANAFIPRMIASGREGRFVTTVGVTALFTTSFAPPGSYSVSKHALLAFSEILHHELRAVGARIGVTVLCPSGVRSEIQGDPAAVDGETIRRPEAWAQVEALYGFIRAGLEPADVAAQTLQAVRDNRFWVFPHPHHVARAQHRADYIVAGTDPTPPPQGPPPAAKPESVAQPR